MHPAGVYLGVKGRMPEGGWRRGCGDSFAGSGLGGVEATELRCGGLVRPGRSRQTHTYQN